MDINNEPLVHFFNKDIIMERIISSIILGLCLVYAGSLVDLDVIIKVNEKDGKPHASIIIEED